MDPVAFSILGLDVRWYGILISTGMLLGIILAQYNSKWRETQLVSLTGVSIWIIFLILAFIKKKRAKWRNL